MSIKGIDAQHMVTRTADFMKDSSAQMKKNELMQDYMAVQAKMAGEQEKQSVSKIAETRMNPLKTDKDGGGAQGEDAAPGDGREREEEEKTRKIMEQLIDTDPHRIDVKI